MTLRQTALALLATAFIGQAQADDAITLYQENCAKCHGANGQARTTRGYMFFAKNLTNANWQKGISDEELYNVISNGPGWYSVMPAFRKSLSEAERRQLVTVVRSFSKAQAQ